MKLKPQTLAGNHQFHYLAGKHKMFNVTVAAKFSTRAKIKTHGIVAYTFLDVCEKNSPVSVPSIKKMHTEENWFISFCITVYKRGWLLKRRVPVVSAVGWSALIDGML